MRVIAIYKGRIQLNSDKINELSKEIHSPVPFWFVNGPIDESQVAREFEMMREKGIGSVVVHPRYGLEVEYLSDEWFEIFGWCLREAKARGMRLWIYDELNWPSGTAGNRVQKIDPNFCSKHLSVEAKPLSEIDFASFEAGKVVVAANIEGGRVTKTRLIDDIDSLKSLTGNWTVFNCTLGYDESYVDTMSLAAVECFKNLTHEEYFKRFGDDFGETISAFFTDEPSIYWVSTGYDDWNLPYTDDFFATFEERFGYSPAERIPYLFYPGNTAFRADFWDHAGYLFNERYHGTLGAWCREHGVIYTGHTHHEEPLRYQVRFQGNMFDAMRAMDIPGIDHLGKTTLGNYFASIIAHKICSSEAHFSGKARVMSESFGVMEWDTKFANLKRVADWQFALGVNLLVPHALYHTISGPTKRESPPSFFFQSPHWDDFRLFSEYINRMEDMLTGGKHVCRTAVMYPQSGLWASYQPDKKTSDFEHTDNFLNSLCLELVKHQVDFDLLDYRALSDAKLEDSKIKIADEEYSVLIVPSTPYMRPSEVQRLTEIVRAGVYTTLCHKSMEPGPQNVPDSLKGANFVRGDEVANFIEILRKNLNDDITINGGGTDDIMVYRREKDGRKITFLLNRSEKHRKVMAMIKDYPDAAIFDHETGVYTRLEGRRIGTRIQAELRFQPGQSYFIVSNAPDAAPAVSLSSNAAAIPIKNLTASLPFNVGSVYNFTYTKDGSTPMELDIRTNPRHIPVSWDKNPPNFEEYAGIYEAEVEINLPGEGIKLVLDGDYAACEIYVNGTQIELHAMRDNEKLPTSSGYLTDFSDLSADVSALLKTGKNTFRVVSPTKLSEPLRLVGDFRVHVAGRLLELVPPSEIDPLDLAKDYPFYSGTVTYRADFDLPKAYTRQELVLHNVNDTAEVWVNGHLAGRRLWSPYRLDIAPFTQIGTNKIEIKTRNNMANLILGAANPLGLSRVPSLAGFE